MGLRPARTSRLALMGLRLRNGERTPRSCSTSCPEPRASRHEALRQYGDALRLAHAAGAHVGIALALDAIASAALDRGEVDRGIRLSSAADRLRKDIGGNVGIGHIGLEEPLTRAQGRMGPAQYERAVEHGRALTADQAVAMALEDVPTH